MANIKMQNCPCDKRSVFRKHVIM